MMDKLKTKETKKKIKRVYQNAGTVMYGKKRPIAAIKRDESNPNNN